MSAPFSPADAAPAAAETGCCATEARTPRRPGHRVHPATHNRPSTGAQPPLHVPAPASGCGAPLWCWYRTTVSPVRRASSAELRSIIALTQPLSESGYCLRAWYLGGTVRARVSHTAECGWWWDGSPPALPDRRRGRRARPGRPAALALQLAAESSCAREGGGGDRDWTIQKVARTLTAAVMRRISLQHLVFLVTA